jgi:hypothetical protein
MHDKVARLEIGQVALAGQDASSRQAVLLDETEYFGVGEKVRLVTHNPAGGERALE